MKKIAGLVKIYKSELTAAGIIIIFAGIVIFILLKNPVLSPFG